VSITRAEIEEAEENEIDGGIDVNESMMRLPIAESLDVCMNILFKHFNEKLGTESKCTNEQQKQIQDALFQYFNEHIIKTHNSKHVHFVFFYISSFRKSFQNELLNLLISKILDRNKPPVIRQYAIGYLSSLLARAKFIALKSLKSYLAQICNFAHEYINACNSVSYNMSPKAHAVFHAACQAIFYIIAFRHKDLDLANSRANLEFLLKMNLQPIVKHPLNPLFYCLPAIATIFDSVMSKHQIIYCQAILYKNASRKLATVYMTNENHNPEEIIESVFPFDPYLLKKSGSKIHPIYVEYQGADDDEASPTKSRKRTRNESECCDTFIIPVKKSREC
jgi:RNA polymerase I-specific transcription initiation factor RRN3